MAATRAKQRLVIGVGLVEYGARHSVANYGNGESQSVVGDVRIEH